MTLEKFLKKFVSGDTRIAITYGYGEALPFQKRELNFEFIEKRGWFGVLGVEPKTDDGKPYLLITIGD